jgi:uncharacterized protein (DUF488 family)
MPSVVYTLGYQGLKLEEFLDRLHQNEIAFLADLRENPFSRKPGFSQESLAHSLHAVGIAYQHYPELGCPRLSRHHFRATGNLALFKEAYLDHLDRQKAAIQALLDRILSTVSVLMCLERDPEQCHRSLLVERLQRLASGTLHIHHLM